MGTPQRLERPEAPPRLKIGAMYEFHQLTALGHPMAEGERWRGRVRREYRRFWLIEHALGFYTCVHKHSVGVDWRVRQI